MYWRSREHRDGCPCCRWTQIHWRDAKLARRGMHSRKDCWCGGHNQKNWKRHLRGNSGAARRLRYRRGRLTKLRLAG